jgi:hypothetical protein
VTDKGLEHLAALSSLAYLRIESDRISDAGAAAFASRMPALCQFFTTKENLIAIPSR